MQIGARLFVDGGLLRNIPWDAFGKWGSVIRTKKRRRRDVVRDVLRLPHRTRGVLALSIRGADRQYSKIVSTVAEDAPRPPASKNRTFFGIPLLPTGEAPEPAPRRRNDRGFAGLWEFGNQLVELVTFGEDSPNALPPDHPSLDVVRIDTFDVSAADFDLDDRARAHLVSPGV